MSFPLAIVVFEVFVTIASAGVFIVLFLRKSWLDLVTLGGASIFGVTLEFCNVLLFETYHYNVLFLLQIGIPPQNIPLSIGLAWGLIIYSSMIISDSKNFSNHVRPFMDATLALTIDLSMDAIAIRLDGGFWTWFVPLTTSVDEVSFFGVPYGNFYGWWMVVFIFSNFVRYGRGLWAKSKKIGVCFFGIAPFLSYIPLYFSLEMIRGTAILLFGLGFYSERDQAIYFNTLYLAILVMIIGILIPIIDWKYQKKDFFTNEVYDTVTAPIIPRITFLGFHLIFFLLGTLYQIWFELPLILILSLLLFSFHVYLSFNKRFEIS